MPPAERSFQACTFRPHGSAPDCSLLPSYLCSLVYCSGMGADRSPTARVQRMLVHLIYLVYLVCLVDGTGNSFRRTRQTRKTSQPDRRARVRCASTEDHQAPSHPCSASRRTTRLPPPFFSVSGNPGRASEDETISIGSKVNFQYSMAR